MNIFDVFLTCSLCVGFWSGIIISIMVNSNMAQHIVLGLSVSASSWLYDSVVGSNQSREVYLNKKIESFDKKH